MSSNYFHDEVDETLGYNLHQILGPKLAADLYAEDVDAHYYYQDGNQFTTNELLFGLRFTYIMGPKTTLPPRGEYASSDIDQTNGWTGRVDLCYNFTNTLQLHFLYQYQQSNSQTFERNYKENLFFLSLTKYFE